MRRRPRFRRALGARAVRRGTGWRSATLVLAGLLLGGCGRSGLPPREAAAIVEPHLDHLEAYERWSRRIVSARVAFSHRSALEEALFAPVRRTDPVWGVWVFRSDHGPPDLHWGHRTDPPKALSWTAVQHERLGELEISAATLADPRRSRFRAEEERCVLVRRRLTERPLVFLVVAYRIGDSAADRGVAVALSPGTVRP